MSTQCETAAWVNCTNYRRLVYRVGERYWLFDAGPEASNAIPMIGPGGAVKLAVLDNGATAWRVVDKEIVNDDYAV